MRHVFPILTLCIGGILSATASPYELNFSDTQRINLAKKNTTSAISLCGQAGQQIIDVNQPNDFLLYHKTFSTPFIVLPGETVTASINFSGKNMNAYVYIDYNNDGTFDPDTEAVAYSNLNGTNSAGETSASNSMTLPAFVIPEDILPGTYRIRYKVDNNSLDPAGNNSTDENIVSNNGSITDAMLLVCENENIPLRINGETGRLVQPDRQALPTSVCALESIVFKGLPDMGQHLESVRVEYGYPDMDAKYGNTTSFSQIIDGYDIFRNEGVIPSFTVAGECVVLTPEFASGNFVDPNEKDGYRLVWNDEFNQPDGTSADMTDNWGTPSRMDATWRRFVTDRDDLREIHNGRVILAAKVDETDKSWVTGALETVAKFNYTYGYTEARLKCNYKTGSFPAYWMMPEDQSDGWPNCGEIDIWEAADGPTRSWHTIHGPWNNDGGSITSGALTVDYSKPIVYGFEWTPDYLEWFIDGKSVFKIPKSYYRIGESKWVFDKPYFIRINQSVGDGGWAGTPDPSTVYTTEFDYVRVYQKEGQQNEGGKTYSIDYFNSDIIDRTTIEPDTCDSVTYTDLLGRTVTHPQHAGIYIEHANNRSKKIIYKK